MLKDKVSLLCSACKKYPARQKISGQTWLKLGITNFQEAGIAYLCRNCQIDIGMKGEWTGEGWTWLEARKQEKASQ